MADVPAWPRYADGLSVDAIRELYEAAEVSLRGGAHPGPCDNDDLPGEACSLHVAAAEARRARLSRAVGALEDELMNYPGG